MHKHEIKTVGIDELKPNEYNANKMSEAKFEALVDTIKRNGQTHPIQVVKDNDHYRIIGGEHKWRAMKLLNYKECQIIERQFEDETEEKLNSLEDNIHGSPIPIKEALIIASATKKYKLPELRKRLGEEEIELKDKLLLVVEEEKLKKLEEQLNQEHTVEMDFVVDAYPEDNAKRAIKEIERFAKNIGCEMISAKTKISKSKETVALLTFNVSEMQKNVIEKALKKVTGPEKVKRSRALELIAADFLSGQPLQNVTKTSNNTKR